MDSSTDPPPPMDSVSHTSSAIITTTESADLEVLLPEVPDEGVLVKTLFAGICHVTSGHRSDEEASSQCVSGHEVCGKVLSVGCKVPEDCSFRVGDVVIVYPWPGCAQCEICSAGCQHLCEEHLAQTCQPADSLQDTTGTGHCVDSTCPDQREVVTEDDVRDGIAEVANGCFNSFQVIKDWQQVVRLPREIPAQVGCLLPCSGLRAYVALLDARPCFDQAVRVRGFANLLIVAGDSVDGLELWCIQLLKTVFCNRNVKVVCASGRRDRADLAIRAGADDAVLLPAGSTTSQLVDATTMSGYNRMDVSIDLQGDARSFTVALRSLHRGGTLIELGTGSAESAASVQVPPLAELVARSVTLIGVKSGSLVQLRQLVDVLAVQRNVGVDDVPVELYSPAQLDSAVQRTKRHLANGHVIIKYD